MKTEGRDLRAPADDKSEDQDHRQMERRQYLRFGAMIATSTMVMFMLTYTNVYAFGHVRWSEERVYMALLMGGSVAASYVLQILSSAAAIVLVARVWSGSADIRQKGATLILATFLATPYAWDYDLVALTLAAALLATNGIKNGFQPWEKSLLALTVAMPLIISPIANTIHVQIAPFVLWSMLLLTTRRAALRNPLPVVAAP